MTHLVSDAIYKLSKRNWGMTLPPRDMHTSCTWYVSVHSPPLFLAYGTSYRMTYGRSNPYIVSERN